MSDDIPLILKVVDNFGQCHCVREGHPPNTGQRLIGNIIIDSN